jgi:hypothetical protein
VPNTFKYNTSSIESQSLRKGNFYIGTGDVGKGTSDSTGFYNGFPLGTFSYVIVLHRGGNIPTYYRCQDDAELISRTNQIDTSSVRTTKEQCFSYFASQSDKMVVNKDYQYVVTDGLVLNLDASFLPSFPATGDSWFDLSTSVNNGSLNNSPSWNSAGFFTFDGVNDSISRAYNSSFNIKTGITLSALFRRNSIFTQLSDCFILSRPPAWYFYDEYNAGTIRGDVYIDGTRRGNISVSMPNDGRWYEFVYTYDSSTGWAIMYRNGVSASSTQVTGLSNYLIDSSNANFLSIFLNTLGKSYFVNSLKIYNRALSSSEVLQNYYGGPIVTLGLTFAIDASSFVSYDRLGTTWSNMATTTVNGTLQNGPTFSFANVGTIYFDGNNDRASFGIASNLDFENFTVGIWAKSPTNTSGDSGFPIHVTNLIGKGDWNNNNSWRIGYKSTGTNPATFITFGYGIVWSSGPQFSVGSFNLANWNYFVGVATTTQQLLYLNGSLVSSVNLSKISVVNTEDFQIGRSSYTDRFFTGNIGPSHIYNRALSAAEVAQNFNAHRSRFDI